MTYSLRLSFTLPVPKREAFALLTDARKIRAWSGQAGRVRPEIGGTFRMFDGWVTGFVLAYQPGKHLAYTWLPADWKKGTAPSIVVYRFEAKGKGSRISIRHAYLPTKAALRSHKTGWHDHVVDPLKSYLIRKGA